MKIRSTMITMTAVLGILALAPGAMAAIIATGAMDPDAATWESGYIDGRGDINGGKVTVDGVSILTTKDQIYLNSGTLTVSSGGKVIVGGVLGDEGHFLLANNITGATVTLTVTGTGSTFIVGRAVWGRGDSTRNFEITNGGVFLRSGLSIDRKGPWNMDQGGGMDINMSGGAMGVNFSTVTTLATFLSDDLASTTPVYYNYGGVLTQLTSSSDQAHFALTKYNADNSTPEGLDGTMTPFVAPTWNDTNWVLNGVTVDGYTVLSVIPEPGTIALLGLAGLAMLIRRRFVK